jgi:hypothetical protein
MSEVSVTKVDLSAFDAVAASSSPRRQCQVGIALEELPPDQVASLAAALGDSRYTGTVIAKTVTGWGAKLSPTSANRHRRGECCCDR